VLIGLYISWAFRKVSEPVASWKYGLLTMFCAAHDVIIPLGVFAVIGHYWHWEVGTAFIAAMLTILGYSISDTVVVFDRTRENLSRHTGEPFDAIVEKSIQQTYVRSINTSVTVLLALTSILVFGGESTRPFALALLIGVLVGTYSSIFFASPALVEWEGLKRK
jgi:preprotein translocase SecF subunit